MFLSKGQKHHLVAKLLSKQKILINWTHCYVAVVTTYELLAHFDL
jgi:hypothetical protein